MVQELLAKDLIIINIHNWAFVNDRKKVSKYPF